MTSRLDAARVAIGRLLVSAVSIAAGLIVVSFLTPSSAATMSVQSVQPASGAWSSVTSGTSGASGASVPPVPSIPSGRSTPAEFDAAARLGEDSPAGAAIAALTGTQPQRALALIPSGFADDMGYQPVLDLGVPANPDGGCSSPIALPASFDAPCKTHDLGYDLLRYSADTGAPLGQWARQAVDAQLVRRMHASCPVDSCWAAADIAAAGVTVNSQRQADGVPTTETRTQIVTSVIRMIWQPVVMAAQVLGTPTGRAVVAALIALAAVHVRRRSRPVFADGWPTVWSVLRHTSIRIPLPRMRATTA